VACCVLHNIAIINHTGPFKPNPIFDDFVPPPPPSLVPLFPSKEQRGDTGRRYTQTLYAVDDLLEPVDAARAGLRARDVVCKSYAGGMTMLIRSGTTGPGRSTRARAISTRPNKAGGIVATGAQYGA
jgi:hypothetical protein